MIAWREHGGSLSARGRFAPAALAGDRLGERRGGKGGWGRIAGFGALNAAQRDNLGAGVGPCRVNHALHVQHGRPPLLARDCRVAQVLRRRDRARSMPNRAAPGESGRPCGSSLRLRDRVCGSVTGMMHSAPTPTPHPGPGALSTLLVHDTPVLAGRSGIGVLCTIETPPSRPIPPSSPAPFTRPPPVRAAGR